mmetsp:Transcript_85408/g.215317  ORF Transcript_85408/g.215317 Transcript_85408/m.215317 type:complete len:269 (+) Transcript_85408:321-1127(+)
MTLVLLQNVLQHLSQFLLVDLPAVIGIIPTPHLDQVIISQGLQVELAKKLLAIDVPGLFTEVLHRLHLDEAAHCAVPSKDFIGDRRFLFFLCYIEETDRVKLCGTDELRVSLIEGIYHRDETPDLVSLLKRELRNVRDKDCVECISDRQVVSCTKGLVAEIFEAEIGNIGIQGSLGHHNTPALGLNLCTNCRLTIANSIEFPLKQLLGILVIGEDVDSTILLFAFRDESVVCLRSDVVHIAEVTEHRYERQEEWPVEAIEVKVLGGPI